mgnify:CR=1 FL=1
MKKLFWLPLIAVTLFSTGCSTNNCKKGELTFELPNFSLNTEYTTPGTIYSKGPAAVIDQITYQSGQKSFGSGKIVNTTAYSFGSGQMIRMNNTVLNFDFRSGTTKAEFEYLDQGGTINLGAHGWANLYVGSMYNMPASMVINGVTITKSNVKDHFASPGVKSAETGVITLTFYQDIGSLVIGGQEMYLDNFCFN